MVKRQKLSTAARHARKVHAARKAKGRNLAKKRRHAENNGFGARAFDYAPIERRVLAHMKDGLGLLLLDTYTKYDAKRR